MQFETLAVTLENHIATVRLNRPEKANAMNAAMWQDIRKAFQWVDETPEARVAILQGEGKLFTAGIDLQMMMTLAPQAQNDCDGRSREALRRVILDMQDTLTSLCLRGRWH
jgi:enoyl-CoA hydratase